MTFAVRGNASGVREAAEALEAWTDRERLADGPRRRILTAFDEILSNVVRHGRPDGTGVIEITIDRNGDQVRATVADNGRAFDPLAAPLPDTSAGLEARVPGGLGIALVRALTDEVRYERRDDRNRLSLTWHV
jgi:anti-sigma regulatory factor (Ser/Thr protein kinase)